MLLSILQGSNVPKTSILFAPYYLLYCKEVMCQQHQFFALHIAFLRESLKSLEDTKLHVIET